MGFLLLIVIFVIIKGRENSTRREAREWAEQRENETRVDYIDRVVYRSRTSEDQFGDW